MISLGAAVWQPFEDGQLHVTLDAQHRFMKHATLLMQTRKSSLMRCIVWAWLVGSLAVCVARAQTKVEPGQTANPACRIEAVDYKGWNAQQVSNHWVHLIVVPQNGGRLMQVIFAGHDYLFVNPKYAGKYLPPTQSQWFNYGGDKIWLLPEGSHDEQHWAGGSDLLDDGAYSFRKLSEGQTCEIELSGPPDRQSGIQFIRTIHLDADSPRIRFHVVMKNTTGHDLEWSMQSVSQYDTADPGNRAHMNRNFWTFTPVNPSSSYLNHYHVRFGPAENRAVSVREDGLFVVHYAYLAAELWLDSTAGWLTLVDGNARYAMVERFRYEEAKPYPGKASVIFWTNGPELRLNAEGIATLGSGEGREAPYYLEAEINSPLCRLRPGESCNLDTEWFPTRAGSDFHGINDAGVVVQPLRASRLESGKIRLSGSFGVFFPGRLVARFYNEHGSSLGTVPVVDVDPAKPVFLETEISSPGKSARLSLHLDDANGVDRGSLEEVPVSGAAETH